MLIVSTALSIGHKLYPSIAEFMATNAEGRSLDEMSSLAQYAFEAFENIELNLHILIYSNSNFAEGRLKGLEGLEL